ncbi:MAG: 2-hydroxyacyl-CoA dehydratase family protein [Dehalococcoidia bacterium]|nr:2-hydroxyacyl-CoA dehydratase family protein [Dehalococcoidia bacterium]MDD5648275.1 2-hydroxyacyl-CoA dehydratase family protein [Dehalococcoidia bacterium]
MEEVLTKFRTIADKPYEMLAKRKEETGIKIVGCLPMYVPEEIIHAAGALPIVLQEGDEPITLGHSKIQSFFCGIVRSIVDLALKSKLNFLDAVVSPEIDLPIAGLANILKTNMRVPVYAIYQPPFPQKSTTPELLLREIKKCKSELEGLIGQEITDERLGRSIEIYNKNRSLLRKLYELRKKKPGILKSVDVRAIVMASMLMLKEEHNQLLEDLLSKLKTQNPSSKNKVNLVLSGSVCEAPPVDMLNMLEEEGAVIVNDDMYTGARYFCADVQAGNGSLLDAIVKRQLTWPIPCPTKIDEGLDWGNYLVDLARASEAKGVIHMVVKYCQPHEMYYPYLSKKLAKAGIPDLKLEFEHETISMGSTKTRIQAFMEMIKKR